MRYPIARLPLSLRFTAHRNHRKKCERAAEKVKFTLFLRNRHQSNNLQRAEQCLRRAGLLARSSAHVQVMRNPAAIRIRKRLLAKYHIGHAELLLTYLCEFVRDDKS